MRHRGGENRQKHRNGSRGSTVQNRDSTAGNFCMFTGTRMIGDCFRKKHRLATHSLMQTDIRSARRRLDGLKNPAEHS